jgi:hypothetical protein
VAERRRVLLVGGGDLAGEVCEALEAGGGEVEWLADDEAVREALESARPDIVCVATRDDAFPLRMALLVRHLVAVRRRLGAAYIAGVALGSDAESVAARDGTPELILPDGGHAAFPLEIAK